MSVLVDTPVWSLALRRKAPDPLVSAALTDLIARRLVRLIGPVRQELLSGIASADQFEQLRKHLGSFPGMAITRPDYEQAAAFTNLCRSRGVQGSNTDFLICAVAVRTDCAIWTLDRDFLSYAKCLPIRLHPHPLDT